MANSALKEAANVSEGVDFDHPLASRSVEIIDAGMGLVRGKRKRYAVCGFASSSRHLMPINDQSWEIWGLNQLYRHIPRADRWFDIHRNWNEEVVPGTDHHGWIRDSRIPVYMMEQHPEFPMSVRFPVDRLLARFGVDYFTSSIAFMVALALDEIDMKVEQDVHDGKLDQLTRGGLSIPEAVRALYGEYEIGIFGVDLVVGEEYFEQKPCAEFWIGAAAIGRGVKVYIPSQSALCKQLYRYGYEKEPGGILKSNEVKAHHGRVAKERDELLRQIYMRDGALQADEYWTELLTLRERGANVVG
jgi:hypothetical protein